MTFFEISREIAELMERLENGDYDIEPSGGGEPSAEALLRAETEEMLRVRSRLETMELDWADKVANIVRLYVNWCAEEVACDSNIKRLTKRRDSLRRRAAALKDYLAYCLAQRGVEKWNVPGIATLSMRNNPPSVLFPKGEDAVPDEFCKVERTPLKTPVREALQNGATFDWAELVSTRSLTIR